MDPYIRLCCDVFYFYMIACVPFLSSGDGRQLALFLLSGGPQWEEVCPKRRQAGVRPLPQQVLCKLLRRMPSTDPCGIKGAFSQFATTEFSWCMCFLGLSTVAVLPLCFSHQTLPVSFLHQELSHKGRYWHEECFRCSKCYKPLAKEPFSTKDDRIMCGKCCSREDAPRCHGCYKPILAGKTTTFTPQCCSFSPEASHWGGLKSWLIT